MCSSGEFYLSSRNPGPTQPGTPPRDPIWLCYLYHLPAVADAAVGTALGKFAFNCTENLIPYTTAVDYGLDFDAWMSLGLDEGDSDAGGGRCHGVCDADGCRRQVRLAVEPRTSRA